MPAQLSHPARILLDKVRRLRYNRKLVTKRPPYTQEQLTEALTELVQLAETGETPEERQVGLESRKLRFEPADDNHYLRWFNHY